MDSRTIITFACLICVIFQLFTSTAAGCVSNCNACSNECERLGKSKAIICSTTNGEFGKCECNGQAVDVCSGNRKKRFSTDDFANAFKGFGDDAGKAFKGFGDDVGNAFKGFGKGGEGSPDIGKVGDDIANAFKGLFRRR